MSDDYANIHELVAPEPIERSQRQASQHQDALESHRQAETGPSIAQAYPRDHQEGGESRSNDVPTDFANLDELTAPEPVENLDEQAWFHHEDLESRKSRGSRSLQPDQTHNVHGGADGHTATFRMEDTRSTPATTPAHIIQLGQTRPETRRVISSQAWTEICTTAYLVFFSIMGTLARLGVEWLTFYPGTPSVFPIVWANFGGSLILGFLVEDRRLFQHYHENPTEKTENSEVSSPSNGESGLESNINHPEEPPVPSKKVIPLYIGLAIGFCGSFTSFSSWMGDEFNGLANNLRTPIDHPTTSQSPSTYTTSSRSAGYSVMAILAICLITLALSLAALKMGAHIAILIEPGNIHISSRLRRALDISILPLGYGCWIGAILMAIFPPEDSWRGKAIFAIVFAPLGCLLRFYTSLKLNGRSVAFPIGTFVVNMLGTAVYGLAYDGQHASGALAGGIIGCQVWQGVMDGFCGALTTVSTFAAEIEGLRRLHAYVYGTASVVGGLSLLIIIMGGMDWTVGFQTPVCVES